MSILRKFYKETYPTMVSWWDSGEPLIFVQTIDGNTYFRDSSILRDNKDEYSTLLDWYDRRSKTYTEKMLIVLAGLYKTISSQRNTKS